MSCLQSGLVVVVKSPCLAALFQSEYRDPSSPASLWLE